MISSPSCGGPSEIEKQQQFLFLSGFFGVLGTIGRRFVYDVKYYSVKDLLSRLAFAPALF